MPLDLEKFKRKKGVANLRALVKYLKAQNLNIENEADLYASFEFEQYNFADLDSEAIALLVYDGGSLYSIINNEFGYELSEEFYQELDRIGLEYEECNSYSMLLYQKETAQQKWNRNNKTKIQQSDRTYNQKNPVISFRPSDRVLAKLEQLRQPLETQSDLINRIISHARN